MPQRVANVSITLHRKNKDGVDERKVVNAGETFDFTKDEISQLTALNKEALRKPINEELPPTEANNDGSQRDPNSDVIDTTGKESDLTPAEKAKQTKAANAKAKADEEKAGDAAADDGL